MNKLPLTIAIVDDSTLMRETARFRVKLLGFQVIIEAENGQDFLNQLNKNKTPDICLLDINMPVMNGIETARYLSINWPDIRIIFHSLEIRHDYASEELALAKGGFLSKLASSQEFKNALFNPALFSM